MITCYASQFTAITAITWTHFLSTGTREPVMGNALNALIGYFRPWQGDDLSSIASDNQSVTESKTNSGAVSTWPAEPEFRGDLQRNQEGKTKQTEREEEPQLERCSATESLEPVTNARLATEAFRQCRGHLMTGIMEPLILANHLYSQSIVPRETVDRVLIPTLSLPEKTIVLLNAMEHRLGVKPSDFNTLVSLLEEEASLRVLAERLRETYYNIKMSLQTSTQCLLSPVERYANYLKGYYKRNKILPEHDKMLPFLNKKFQFISLAIVEKEELDPATVDEFTKATLHHGCIDVILKKKKPILLEDLLRLEEGEEDSRVILVEGASGIGKSTMSWELCRQWDNFESLKRFSMIILFCLRDKRVQEATTIAELVYHDNSQLQQEVVEHLLASEGEGTLLIFDGFDEIHGTCKLLADIIDGRKLCKSTVIVTSRPSARAKLLSLCQALEIFKHVEVLGFTLTKIKEYTNSVFESNPSLLADFTKYIDSSPAIQGLMYIPLNCCMVVEIYHETRRGSCGRPIPHTMTQLYEELCLIFLGKYLMEIGMERDNSLPHELDSLPKQVLMQLLALGKMALEGVVNQEVIFDSLPKDCSTLGLVNVSTELYIGRRKSYNFHHLTLQEFVAAFYVCKLPANEQRQVFSENCTCQYMDVVWRFVAGLSGMEGIGWDNFQSMRGFDGESRVVPFFIQCLYEAQRKVDIDTVIGKKEVTFKSCWTATPFDCYAVGYCVASSHCAWRLDLRYLQLGAELTEMLVNGLNSRSMINGSIAVLELEDSNIGMEGMTFLNGMPKMVFENINYLHLSSCNLDSKCLDLLSELISNLKRLTDFSIRNNWFRKLEKLIYSLSCLSNLHTLDIIGNTLICTDIPALSGLIRPSGPLRKLAIGNDEISEDCVELMMKTLLVSPSSLQNLTVAGVFLITGSAFHYLKANYCITSLTLLCCSLHSTGFSHLFNALHENTILEQLVIYDYCVLMEDVNDCDDEYVIGHEGALALVDMIKVNFSLKEINIGSDQSLGQDDIVAIIAALEHNHSLQILRLHNGYKRFILNSVDSRVMWDE